MAKKYNFYFYPFNWEWRNVSLNKIKEIVFTQYGGLFEVFLETAYSDLKIDVLSDCVKSKRYKWNKKTVVSICEIKE